MADSDRKKRSLERKFRRKAIRDTNFSFRASGFMDGTPAWRKAAINGGAAAAGIAAGAATAYAGLKNGNRAVNSALGKVTKNRLKVNIHPTIPLAAGVAVGKSVFWRLKAGATTASNKNLYEAKYRRSVNDGARRYRSLYEQRQESKRMRRSARNRSYSGRAASNAGRV